MIAPILPPAVESAEAFGEEGERAGLFPAEARCVEDSVPGRVREFTAVRHCARTALGRLGLPPSPLVPADGGAPVWPAGVVGSMTHCSGYRAAAVARSAVWAGLGIDAEPDEPLPGGVLEAVSLPAERAGLAAFARARPGVHADRLLWSAKESVFKVWYPLARRRLDPTGARVRLDPGGTFRARFPALGPGPAGRRATGVEGTWRAHGGLLVTAAYVPAAPAPQRTADAEGYAPAS
ncbi:MULTISPECIES: 4'-phosphopantetheinyl transferase [unclassified Streptomyces]|uniref:4'-phosphopantetheinyl transferase family protein n=1 Tax=unclassified Streptomyces TaxID=2593676 RepID=UPI0036FBE20B